MAIAGTLTYKTELDTSGVKKSGSTVKSIIAGLGITKLISKAMSTITSSIDDAISRVDTLNNFPKVMSNLGVSAEDSSKAIQRMSDKLSGLPTTLDQGAMAVQRFTSKNGNVAKSTDIFLALNNAILAGGASTEIQAQALEQMSQAYAKGKPDMMEWRSIMTAMPAQLNQVADAMGYGKNGADALGEALRKGDVSMDKFMDTIIRLNKDGSKGFASFEKQARNSTAGIGTAVTVAKTQVVKGLADIIQGIDKGLKKSGTSISKIIANLGKKAKEMLDKIAKSLSKIDFNKLYNILKAIIPVVGSLVAGMIAYNTALKAIQLAGAIKNFASLTSQFITMIPALNGAKLGMVALNSTFSVSPIGLVVAGVTGLTAGLILLSKATSNQKSEQEKITQTLQEYNKSMKEADNSRQSYLDKNMSELSQTEALYHELEAIVDENGKVKAGYEDRAKFIVGQLNEALGTEIKLNNGVIQGYKGIRDSIADIIEQKRAKILLDAQEKVYNEAKDKAVKLEQNYANAQKEYNKVIEKRDNLLKEIQKTYGLTSEQLESVSQNMYYFDENGKKVNISLSTLGKELGMLNGKLETHKSTLEEAKNTYISNQQIIGNYEQSLKDLADGNYQAVLKMYEDTTNYQAKTNEETKKKYQGAIDSQKAYLEYLKKNRSSYNEDVYNREVQAVEERIKILEEEQNKANTTISSGQTTIKGTWKKGLTDQINELTGKNIAFKETADGHIQRYINGIEQGRPLTKKEAKKIADEMQKELDKAKNGSNLAGLDFTKGTTQGIKSGQGGTFSAIKDYGNSLLAIFKKSLKEKSPSRATREMGMFLDEGVTLGIKDGEKDTLKAVNNFGENVLDELNGSMDFSQELEDMYKEMNKTIQMENAKLNFDVMSNNAYNKSLQLPAVIDLSANFEGTVPVQLNLDGEKIYDNQQKISLRKSIQYGGVK